MKNLILCVVSAFIISTDSKGNSSLFEMVLLGCCGVLTWGQFLLSSYFKVINAIYLKTQKIKTKVSATYRVSLQ